MCGVIGIVGKVSDEVIRHFVSAGGERQIHRGPDAQGTFFDGFGESRLGLGHQRLSILDLSDSGNQPMHSASGRYTIVFNGEIYNYVELARQYGLQGLKSASDTEIALELLELLGPARAFEQFNGMWAIAALDRKERKLYISRDRFGKKPLYYFEDNNVVYLASELKTFLSLPTHTFAVNPRVASRYLAQSLQDVDNETWFAGVKQMPPATWGYIDVDEPARGIQSIKRYWNYPEAQENYALGFDDFVGELRETMFDAVKIRLRSDVHLGLALSGGLDSSILSGVIKNLLGADAGKVSCFSAVSPGSANDESVFIDRISSYHGVKVNKVELGVANDGSLNGLLSDCSYWNDAPLASFSNALFYLLMERAKALGIKVIFSGQGADEAFCGYKKYPMFEIKRLLKSGRILDAMQFARGFVSQGTIFSQFRFAEAKRYLGRDNASILGQACRQAFVAENISASVGGIAGRQRLDIEKYSVPYLTHYEDRMSMAFSREIRAPFLDYRMVEMGLRAPVKFKMDGGWTKYCLREAFSDLMPPDITWRKDKQGFVNPQDDWMKGYLGSDVRAMINNPNSPIFADGLVNRSAYAKMFSKYCNGGRGIWFRDVFSPFALNVWINSFKNSTL